MRKLYYYDSVHHRRKQQQHTLVKSIEEYGLKRKHLAKRKIGTVNNNNNINNDDTPLVVYRNKKQHRNENNEHKPSQKLTKLTKCAKMTDENGMLRSGSLNGVGIASRAHANNLVNFNYSSTTTTLATSTVTTTTSASYVNNNTTVRNSNRNEQQSNSPSDATNGNSTDGTNSAFGGGNANGSAGGSSSNSGSAGNVNKLPNNNNNNNLNNNIGSPAQNAIGGRLQFFKDGKFILELARSKEGERGGWVSVPRKTYWPPAALSQNNVNNHKNESSTSLSFSDDNSSIQSSPWQRDHCWKQASPRKNISKEMCLYYYRPAPIVLAKKSELVSKQMRRRPHDKKHQGNSVNYIKRVTMETSKTAIKAELDNEYPNGKNDNLDELKTEKSDAKEEKKCDEVSADTVDSSDAVAKSESNTEDEKMEFKSSDDQSKDDIAMAVDSIKRENEGENSKVIEVKRIPNVRQKLVYRPKLNLVIQKLIGRLSEQPMNLVPTLTGPGAGLTGSAFLLSSASRSNDFYYHQQHVSPRKRILREFEKVSLEESSNTTTLKRSRSKSNASSDFNSSANNHLKANSTNVTYATGVTQHISPMNAINSTTDDGSRATNGSQSPHKSISSLDNLTTDRSHKSSKSLVSSTISTSSQAVTPVETPPQPTSRPFSSYSIISLLGHNSTSKNNENKNQNNTDSKTAIDSRRSPKSPTPQQSFSASRPSASMSKKKSPTNGNNSTNVNLSNSQMNPHQSPMNSPINYGRSARSPDLNSPSPDHHSMRNLHHRYQYNALSNCASMSSPTSGFHPYLSTSRGSPISPGTLSPDFHRHRSAYRASGSPSATSSSSLSGGPSHPYTSGNGSPTAFANRYSPSTYSNVQTSPPQSSHPHHISSPYNVSSFLPQAFDGNIAGRSNSISNTHNYSPNPKSRSRDWSPARNSASATSTVQTPTVSSQNSHAGSPRNITPTPTVPKKTVSIRQKYGSPSPNSVVSGNTSERDTSPKIDNNSARKVSHESLEVKSSSKRSRSPADPLRKQQQHHLYEKDIQARYNAELAAHHQSLMASALHQHQRGLSPPGPPPPSHNAFYGGYPNVPPPGTSVSQSMAAAAAAAATAYLNPLYYHSMAYENALRNPLWMHYPATSLSPNSRTTVASLLPYPPGIAGVAGSASSVDLSSPAAIAAVSASGSTSQAHIASNPGNLSWMTPHNAPLQSAFHRQSQQFNENEPISLIKDEPSSDVPLNLSKH